MNYSDTYNFENKIAVVTGAAGIIGVELCGALCELGAKVACLDVNSHSLNQLVKRLNEQYGKKKAISLDCDVSKPECVREAVDEIINQYSNIDILFNNAATKTDEISSFFDSFSEYSLEVWKQVMAVNLDGMFLMAQGVGKYMQNARQGSIVQTASIYSMMGPDQRVYDGSSYLGEDINTPAVYTTSKAGVIGLTKHLATLWGKFNIRVNAICPGGVYSGQNDTFVSNYTNRIPLGRMATPFDIIAPMLFLASDASCYVTGQVLFADGGLSAW